MVQNILRRTGLGCDYARPEKELKDDKHCSSTLLYIVCVVYWDMYCTFIIY